MVLIFGKNNVSCPKQSTRDNDEIQKKGQAEKGTKSLLCNFSEEQF